MEMPRMSRMNAVAARLDWAGIGRLVRQLAVQAVVEHRDLAAHACSDLERDGGATNGAASQGSKR